jgi:hypothetical protein
VLLAAAIVLFFLLPRKYLLAPFLLVTVFIPLSQVAVIGGLHFMVYRLVLPFAWLRALVGRPEEDRFRLKPIDKAVLLWALSSAMCFILLWRSGGAVVERLGFLYDTVGIYFLFRLVIRNRDDVNRTIKVLAIICALIAVFMVHEQITGRNYFSVFGGVPEFTNVRGGRIRSQAAFAHAVIAGTVGATLVPLFVGLWWEGSMRKLAALGAMAGAVMTVTSASATPVGGFAAGIGALLVWPFRQRMRLLRWGAVACIIGLQLVMKAPVWALITRADVVSGSSYQRYELINEAIVHFGEWWLVGNRNPGSWGYSMGDTSDAYVEQGETTGFLTLLLFVGILWQSFRAIGIARKAAEGDRSFELQLWAFGACLFANAVAFIGITYFDQSILIWYSLLAMICAITAAIPASAPEAPPMLAEMPLPWDVTPAASG